MNNLYDIKDIYFSIGGKQISSSKLELTSELTSKAVISSEDRGMSVISFRDPKNITFIFNLEVTLCCQDYIFLTQLADNQFYKMNVIKNDKILDIVFNDRIATKIISNISVFTEEPSRSYSTKAKKVTFEIRAINC